MTMPHTATPAYLAALAQKRNHPDAAAEDRPADTGSDHAKVAAANTDAAAPPQAPAAAPEGPRPGPPKRHS
jgi:hypothetical protein